MALPESWQIVREYPRPSPETIAGFAGLATGPVCDALGRTAAMDYRIRPLDPGCRVSGPAVTVRTRPCDNLALYAALELARPGDVLVVTTGGFTGSSTWGELTTLIARARGVAGLVTDGLVRDAPDIRALGFPVFCQGTTPNSPFKDGPAEINVAIACGGQVVRPGDIVVADADGVVIVPHERAEGTLARVAAVEAKERGIRAEIERTGTLHAAALKMLRDRGL